MSLSTDNPEKRKRTLQYMNDVMHERVAAGDIIVVASHSKKDPRKFTIVADSEYDYALEGVELIFNDAEDFKRIFPDLAKPLPTVLAPGMEIRDKSNVAVPIHQDPYTIKGVYSYPTPDNPEMYSPTNVMDDDETTYWAVNKNPATLLLDLGEDSEIGTLWIKWYQGQTRQFKFIIAVATEEQAKKKDDEDRQSFAIIPHLDEKYSSGVTDQLEPYNLTTDPEILVKARYIMIKVYGNTLNGDWAAISHVKVTRAISIKSRQTDKQIERTTNDKKQPVRKSTAGLAIPTRPDITTPPDKHK